MIFNMSYTYSRMFKSSECIGQWSKRKLSKCSWNQFYVLCTMGKRLCYLFESSHLYQGSIASIKGVNGLLQDLYISKSRKSSFTRGLCKRHQNTQHSRATSCTTSYWWARLIAPCSLLDHQPQKDGNICMIKQHDASLPWCNAQ